VPPDPAGDPGRAFTFDAIGTRWSIRSALPLAAASRDRIRGTIERYDATWSRFRADSAVLRLAATGGPVDLGPDAPPMLALLLRLAALTGGAVTPLIGGSLEHLGYDRGTSLAARAGFVPAPDVRVLTLEGSVVRLAEPAVLDVGAAGKGQLVDLVTAVLADDGHRDVVVDAGGDLRVTGPPVPVALEHPFDPTAAIGVVRVGDEAIAASATNRRSWPAPDGRRLHHVLDGRTGRPVETVAATWAIAGTAMLADALATALFFVEPDTLATEFDFRYLRMWTDGRAHWSADLPGEVFG
jgi:thiamine biosynthesis lipoprotein